MRKKYSFRYNWRHTLTFHIGDSYFFKKGDQLDVPGYSETLHESGVYKLWIIRDESKRPRIKFLREPAIIVPFRTNNSTIDG